MNTTENQKVVKVEGITMMGTSAPTLTFCFGCLCVLFCADIMGWFGPGGSAAIALVQLGVCVVYTIGAVILLQRGESFDGNIFLIFAAFFGGVGPLITLGNILFTGLGLPFNPQVGAVCTLLCGIMMIGVIPGFSHYPKVPFLAYFFSALGIFQNGLAGLGVTGDIGMKLSGCTLGIVGVLAAYVYIAGINAGNGFIMPLGKPFFPKD